MDILITGASSGIGKELAFQYATNENKLILLARREEKLKEIQQELQNKTKEIVIISVDIHDTNVLQKKLATIKNVDLLILNAGISLGHTHTNMPSLEKMKNLFNTNLFANHAILEILIPKMIKQKKSKIVFISSLASLISMPTSTIYSSSKRALNAYAEGISYQYQSDGIKVLTILPGFIKSELTDKNNFKMPFFLSTQKGVERIMYAIENNKTFYPFPKIFFYIIKLFNLLPLSLKEKLVKKIQSN